MSESEKTSPVSAFAPPYHLTSREVGFLEEGQEILIPVIEMDDWADTCNQLKANRRRELEARINLNPMIQDSEKIWMLNKVDDEMITMGYAFNYRTNTPIGIRAGIRKQLTKQMISEGMSKKQAEIEAEVIVAKIPPMIQQHIARYIADPPVIKPGKPEKEGDSKNEETASTKETGDSMPPSSESSGELTPDV